MPPVYEIREVRDSTYVEGGIRPVRGFAVTYFIPELDETHVVDVPTNNDVEIDKRIRAEVEKFKKLRKLGA